MTIDEANKLASVAAEKAATKVIDVFSALFGEPEKLLDKSAEDLLNLHNVSDESKLEVRDSLHGLPKAAQVLYLTSYFGAKSASLEDIAATDRAWNKVKQEYKKSGDAWVQYRGANIESVGSLSIVYHKNLVEPAPFASRAAAIDFAVSLMKSAKEIPDVSYDEPSNKFKIDATDIESTEDIEASVLAKAKVSSLIEKLGHDQTFSTELGNAIVASIYKEKESMIKTADSKQVIPGKPDSDLVSGVGNVTDKASAPKGGFPASVPSGRVVTEKPALDSIPTVKPGKYSLESKHDGDNESLAKESDAAIMKLQKAKGYMEEKPEKIYASAGLILAAAHKLGAEKALEILNEAVKTVETPAVVETPAAEVAAK